MPSEACCPRALPAPDLLDIYNRLYAAFGPQHWWPARFRFEMIIGAILTQNTSWKNVEKAIRSLKTASALNPKALHAVPQSKLALLIRSSGFFNLKARRIKAWMAFLFDEYNGSLARMFSETGDVLRAKLLAVSGLGPETVDSILLYAGRYPYFVVDAYTRRIFSRHSMVQVDDSYEAIQDFFTRHLPPDPQLYNEYHALIVQLAKQFCKKEPECEQCPLQYLFAPQRGEATGRFALQNVWTDGQVLQSGRKHQYAGRRGGSRTPLQSTITPPSNRVGD